MLKSYVIEVDGIFAGAAIPQNNGHFRFVPVDTRMQRIRDSIWPTLSELRREARLLLKPRMEMLMH